MLITCKVEADKEEEQEEYHYGWWQGWKKKGKWVYMCMHKYIYDHFGLNIFMHIYTHIIYVYTHTHTPPLQINYTWKVELVSLDGSIYNRLYLSLPDILWDCSNCRWLEVHILWGTDSGKTTYQIFSSFILKQSVLFVS